MSFTLLNWLHHLKSTFPRKENLLKRLPPVRGKLSADEPLSKKNWFGVGGCAQVYFEPADTADLALMIRQMPPVPFTILGAGSNVLIRDGGIPGITIHLGTPFSQIQVQDDLLICGAGAKVMDVSRTAEKNSLSGFEFLCGIPGSVGGGIRMNAGAYGHQIQEQLVSLTVVTHEGDIRTLNQEELANAFVYRKCLLPAEWIFTQAVFKGERVSDKTIISERMARNREKREQGQPIGVRTAGSTFKNPDGMSAWQLIERAGMRGARRGDAEVSQKHANFIINNGRATAKDIEELGEEIRAKVFEKEGIRLEWEVKKLGVDQ